MHTSGNVGACTTVVGLEGVRLDLTVPNNDFRPRRVSYPRRPLLGTVDGDRVARGAVPILRSAPFCVGVVRGVRVLVFVPEASSGTISVRFIGPPQYSNVGGPLYRATMKFEKLP